MKKWKQMIVATFMLALLIVLLPAGSVQAAGSSPAKLGKKDFVYTVDGQKNDFLKQAENKEVYWYWFIETTGTDTKGRLNNMTLGRKVKIGVSTEAYVRKKFGDTAKKKVSKKEKFYKHMKYEQPGYDISIWKSYLEYSYREGKNEYKLRFYLNNKNKVAGAMYFKNPKKVYNYPDKELDVGLTFQAPKGKKVSTKTINGKKVYLIPRGTKIKLKKNAMSKKEYGRIVPSISIWNTYGEQCGADTSAMFDAAYPELKQGKSYDLQNTLLSEWVKLWSDSSDNIPFDMKKLGKYLYFTMKFDVRSEWNGQTWQTNRTKSPAIYYFKFK